MLDLRVDRGSTVTEQNPPAEGQGQQPAPQPAPGSYPAPYAGQPGAQGYGYQQPYGGYAPSPYPVAPPTNTMAVVSLIASITGLTLFPFIGSVVGVITGHMARRQLQTSGEQGGGMATAGLVIGYVGIGLIVLVGLFFLVMFGFFATVATTTSYS